MWTPSFHRFATEADFLAACDAAGWPRDHQARPAPPATVALDIIGPLAAPPAILEGGAMAPGAVDARFHVNALWLGAMPAAWEASEITPGSPSRAFAVPPQAPAPPLPVPPVVAAWKAKRVLANHDLLATVEAAVALAGGLVADAWAGAAEWRRDSDFLANLAATIGLDTGEVDDLFREADAIRS